jgi:hypothetical protein
VVFGGFLTQRDEHDRKQHPAEPPGIEYRHLARHEAGDLVTADPPLNRTGRQADGLAELAQRPASVLLKERQQLVIDLVELDGTTPAHATILGISGILFNRYHRGSN